MADREGLSHHRTERRGAGGRIRQTHAPGHRQRTAAHRLPQHAESLLRRTEELRQVPALRPADGCDEVQQSQCVQRLEQPDGHFSVQPFCQHLRHYRERTLPRSGGRHPASGRGQRNERNRSQTDTERMVRRLPLCRKYGRHLQPVQPAQYAGRNEVRQLLVRDRHAHLPRGAAPAQQVRPAPPGRRDGDRRLTGRYRHDGDQSRPHPLPEWLPHHQGVRQRIQDL